MIKNIDLFEIWISSEKSHVEERIFQHLLTYFKTVDLPNEVCKILHDIAHFFCFKIDQKWQKSQRKRDRFLTDHKLWLQNEVALLDSLKNYPSMATPVPHKSHDTDPGCSRGRPLKPFEDSSIKTKRRRVENLVSSYSFQELSFAAQESARRTSSEHRNPEQKRSLSPEQVLALYLDLDLSERKYYILRSVVNAVHPDCFPSYYAVKNCRKELLPKSVEATESVAEVNLQELLNITVTNILKTLKNITLLSSNTNLTLTCKYGFDGSSGHSTYKQKFENPHITDEYFFLIAFSPLTLVIRENSQVIWSNPKPASSFFCRPIKFLFQKETSTLVKEEESKIKLSIGNLTEYKIKFQEKHLNINYNMLLTMLDGSCTNTLSETNSTQLCFICGASPKEMNTERVVNKSIRYENLRFGLSSLHSWIRCFECLLHIAYRLPFQTWQVRGPENKAKFEDRKKNIQTEFKNQMGLLFDKPKPGFGSTNDDNTARKFFNDPTLSFSITGVDKTLISQFSIILRTISSGQNINLETFSQLLSDTKKLYLRLYPWYYMPSSVHKLLVHGQDIINNFDLPIGQLSEDALESRHKDVRKQRLSHTRKSSRVNTNIDLMNALLLSSDPFLSSLRNSPKRRKIDYSGIESYLLLDNSDNDPLSVATGLNLDNISLYSSSDDSE